MIRAPKLLPSWSALSPPHLWPLAAPGRGIAQPCKQGMRPLFRLRAMIHSILIAALVMVVMISILCGLCALALGARDGIDNQGDEGP